jgi:hypothetical protein
MDPHHGTTRADAANGRPLTSAQLAVILRAAIPVAAGDSDHDLVTTLHVLNSDVLRPSGVPELLGAELLQIAGALREVIPQQHRAALPDDAVRAVSVWISMHRGGGQSRGAAMTALIALFTAAAEAAERMVLAVTVPREESV